MNHSTWGTVLFALALLASCAGPRRPPPAESLQASPYWQAGRLEVSSYRGPDAASPDALGYLAIGSLPADTAGTGPPYRVTFRVASTFDTSLTDAVLTRRTLETDEVETEVRGRHGGSARARSVGSDSLRLEIAAGGAPRVVTLAWPDARRPRVCWDALPLWLRQWAGETTPFEMTVWLLPPLTEVVAHGPTKPVDAVVRRMDGGVIRTPAGRFAAVEFAVAWDSGADAFWFSTAEPHPLVKIETARHLALELMRVVPGRTDRGRGGARTPS